MEPIETLELSNGRTAKVYVHENPCNPRTEFDNLFTMTCSHRRYKFGDEAFEPDNYSGWNDLHQSLVKERGAAVILPLYIYDHSGITISTSPFGCPFDSGQVGFIWATRDTILREYSRKRLTSGLRDLARRYARGEVEVYDMYLRGEVYGYILENKNGEEVDSCWGFFGLDTIKETLKEMENNGTHD